jgi:DNA-binding transcriptional regulator YiaG
MLRQMFALKIDVQSTVERWERRRSKPDEPAADPIRLSSAGTPTS